MVSYFCDIHCEDLERRGRRKFICKRYGGIFLNTGDNTPIKCSMCPLDSLEMPKKEENKAPDPLVTAYMINRENQMMKDIIKYQNSLIDRYEEFITKDLRGKIEKYDRGPRIDDMFSDKDPRDIPTLHMTTITLPQIAIGAYITKSLLEAIEDVVSGRHVIKRIEEDLKLLGGKL